MPSRTCPSLCDLPAVITLLLALTAGPSPAAAAAATQLEARAAAFEAASVQTRHRIARDASDGWAESRGADDAFAAKGLAESGCAWSEEYAYGGVEGPVYAQATFDDGSGEALYVGGDFATAGGVEVFGIARWDGTSWSALGSGMDDAVFALATWDDGTGEALYAGGYFTTAGGVPAAGIARWDGSSWSALGSGVDDSVFALAVFDDGGGAGPQLFAGGFFSIAGGAPAENIARWDGTSWSALGLGVDDEVDALVVHDDGGGGGSQLFVGGFFEIAGGAAADSIASWDGTSWSPVGLGMSDGVVALETFDDGGGESLYAGGFFAEAEGNSVFGIAEWDGADWSDLDGGMDAPVLSLTVFDDGGGEALYAGGLFSSAGSVPVTSPGVASWDGSAWSALGIGVGELFFTAVESLGVFDDGGGGQLYAGGFFFEAGGEPALFHAAWDGTDWSAVLAAGPPGFQGLDGAAYAMTVFDDGSGPALYVGGEFFTAGGVPVHGIARWDGASWSPVGGGMECESFFFPESRSEAQPPEKTIASGCELPAVAALAVYDDGSGPALYAGGSFHVAGGVEVSNVAKWDGVSWSALGTGTTDIVEALAVYDDGGGPDLYAGGEFDFAGGVAAPNVARWDGAVWSAVGTGTDGDVETLAVYDDGGGPDLYAGGEFGFAGGIAASRVARWDGAAWSAVGLGMDGEVETLTVYDDGGGPYLFAGGQFDLAGGVAAASIARWDGVSWSAVGGGMDTGEEFRTVDALAAFDDGLGVDLYAGGFFELAGGVPAANVARWDGVSWTPLGTGTDEEVETLAVFNAPGPSLFAGGFFDVAGGQPSSYFGEWRCVPAELSVDDVTLAEGDAGTTDFVFTVSRSHNATDVTVDVATADGSAVAPADYAALPPQTLGFVAGGVLSQTVTVQVTTDTVEETPTKEFFVELSSASGAVIASAQGVGTILDDDAPAPSVLQVDSVAGTGDGELAECEEARVPIQQLLVTFDRDMNDPAGNDGDGDVTNSIYYRLFEAGPDRDLQSASCSSPAGDDVAVSIDGVSYDGPSRTATVGVAGGADLADGAYRLVACDGLVDTTFTGLAGGGFVRTFRVEQSNLFVNGQLDCGLDGWDVQSTDPHEIVQQADDVDGASISGSAAFNNLTSSTQFSVGQCVAVTPQTTYLLAGSVRLSAAPGVEVFLGRSCGFFTGAGCTGTALPASLDLYPSSDTGGAWQSLESEVVAPSGSTSAFCSFEITTPAAESFGGSLDDLRFEPVAEIFSDGFESGDTSAWSSTVP